MKSVRTSLSAIGVVLALVGSSGMAALVAAAHPICTLKHHDCGSVPSIKACCCGELGSSSDESSPASAKTTLDVTPLSAPVPAPIAAAVEPSPHVFTQASLSPPRSSPVDLSTLFATLLL